MFLTLCQKAMEGCSKAFHGQALEEVSFRQETGTKTSSMLCKLICRKLSHSEFAFKVVQYFHAVKVQMRFCEFSSNK